MSHGMWEAKERKAGKGKEMDFPQEFPEQSPADTLISVQRNAGWTPDLQNCTVISLYCLSH